MRPFLRPPVLLGLFGAVAGVFTVAALASLGPMRTSMAVESRRSIPQPPLASPIAAAVVPPVASRPRPSPVAEPRRLSSSRSASSLEGTVHDLSGAPVAGAQIVGAVLSARAEPSNTDDEPFFATLAITDEHGRFAAQVAPGDYAIFAVGGDRSSPLVEPLSVVPGEQVQELALVLTGRGELSGIVVDASGKPSEGSITVRLKGHSRRLRLRGLKADGRFRVGSLPDAEIELDARARFGGARALLSLAHGETNLVVRLGPVLGEIGVLVTDELGAPVEGAVVQMHELDGMWGGLTSTDAEGRASLVPSGAHLRVEASTEDSASEPVELDLDERPRVVPIHLERRGGVRGRVLLSSGAPAAGKVVLVRLDGPSPDTAPSGADVDEHGCFRVSPLPRGRYELHFDGGDHELLGDAITQTFSILGREDRVLPDLRLDGARLIRGVVVDESGEPVAHADVSVIDARQESSGSRATTDEHGRFTLEGQVFGAVRVRAEGDGVVSPVTLLSGRGDEDVTLVARGVGHISGLLRGQIPPGARVRCADGLWHSVRDSGHYELSCTPGSMLEIEAAGARRSFPVELEEEEQTYVEVRW